MDDAYKQKLKDTFKVEDTYASEMSQAAEAFVSKMVQRDGTISEELKTVIKEAYVVGYKEALEMMRIERMHEDILSE
jgi:predicted transcriptional regulator